jgi:hypothetical protein
VRLTPRCLLLFYSGPISDYTDWPESSQQALLDDVFAATGIFEPNGTEGPQGPQGECSQ